MLKPAKKGKATNGGRHEMRKLAFRPPLVALMPASIVIVLEIDN